MTAFPRKPLIALDLVGRLALAFVLALPLLGVAPMAIANDGTETTKEEWQAEYRSLLRDGQRLRRNAAAARENYTKAQRRGYPRGPARQQFLLDEAEAIDDLAKLEEKIEKLKRDGRQAGALPGWFYEVEDQPLGKPEPAAPAESDPRDREGRNPLYFDSDGS